MVVLQLKRVGSYGRSASSIASSRHNDEAHPKEPLLKSESRREREEPVYGRGVE